MCPSFASNKPLYAGDGPPENEAMDFALALVCLGDEEVGDVAADAVLVCNGVAAYGLLQGASALALLRRPSCMDFISNANQSGISTSSCTSGLGSRCSTRSDAVLPVELTNRTMMASLFL